MGFNSGFKGLMSETIQPAVPGKQWLRLNWTVFEAKFR